MYTYGAYGLTISPTFNATRRAWLDLGGIYVIAHVRGGGGFGEDWRRAGQLERKTKSVSDFIDVAQYLVHSGWATPGMLSCAGESAGGIVIGGAIAARPDLFSAAVIRAGLVNAMRLERIPIGPFNTGEFGSTKTKAGAQMLYAIDAYHHIKEGTAYPGVPAHRGAQRYTCVALDVCQARCALTSCQCRISADFAAGARPRRTLFRSERSGRIGIGRHIRVPLMAGRYP